MTFVGSTLYLKDSIIDIIVLWNVLLNVDGAENPCGPPAPWEGDRTNVVAKEPNPSQSSRVCCALKATLVLFTY